ncbi:alpha/beta fold hydrolase [Kordiimonas pumila]|uniref:Proline iminopeptidase n=1 Tax=Kordiimonas pumila TaxID=2161677 RepID=A0ABV7D5C8_9PROT|nr:alpha/beta hydrolase [Kordiimonas pumila]
MLKILKGCGLAIVLTAGWSTVCAGVGVDEQAATYTRQYVQEIIGKFRHIPTPHAVEELIPVEVGGIQQWISVRGRDRRNPVLLFIHGGPGSPEMPTSWLYQGPWEEYFTVVQWDQRGAGKTSTINNPEIVTPTITMDRMVADGEEMVSLLRKRYNKEKIFILGHSWGTVMGLKIAEHHPEWLHAYIGMGQAINGPQNEQVGYAFALRSAKEAHNLQAIEELTAISPYPSPDGPTPLEHIVTQRKWLGYYGGMTWGRTSFDYEANVPLLSPDYTDDDLASSSQATMYSLIQLIPALSKLSLDGITKIECPIFIFAGRYDYATPSEIAAQWFKGLTAPQKKLFWFESSAHMMQLEQPGKLLMHLVQDIRPLAADVGDVAPEISKSE